MFSRGAGAPRRHGTPANVQCQKCLQRDIHYSYECKAKPQERPYVPRPSRTQQLLNPKLAPELANDEPPPEQRKQGIADGQLARREAERARKRRLERVDSDEEAEARGSSRKRRRSPSVDSRSGSSWRTLSRSRSPTLSPLSGRSDRSRPLSPDPRLTRRHSSSPRRGYVGRPPERLDPERRQSKRLASRSRSRSYSRSSSMSASPFPSQFPSRSLSQSVSPRPARAENSKQRDRLDERASGPPRAGRADWRSPGRKPTSRRQGNESFDEDRGYKTRDGPFRRRDNCSRGATRREPSPQERSLSPYSRRVALTQGLSRS